MAVMMNTLGRRAQAQSDAQPASPPAADANDKEKVHYYGIIFLTHRENKCVKKLPHSALAVT